MIKRLFDVLASFLGLLILSPVLIGLSIICFSLQGRPIFFSQHRVGRKGRLFTLYKFRTMVPSAGAERGLFDVGDNRRVTPLGHFLRRSKLDELPQLWNVLRGEMSVVGPRPEVDKWVCVYAERWKLVHAVRPGITDLASIIFRNEELLLADASDRETLYRQEILPRKLSLYEEYVETQSLMGDCRILFWTFCTVVWPGSVKGQP